MQETILAALAALVFCGISTGCSPSSSGGSVDSSVSHDGGVDDAIVDGPVSDTSKPPEPPIGDWFLCLNSQCSIISYNGWRFETDGTTRWTYGEPPTLEGGETYCYTERQELNLTYTYSKDTLQMTHNWNSYQSTYTIEFKGDLASVTEKGDTKTIHWRRVWPARASSPCASRSPWICPRQRFETGFRGTGCRWSWECDNGSFALECAPDSSVGFICTCLDGQKSTLGKFSANNACDSSSKGMDLANAKCSTELWDPPISTPP
jgi:hypothetical protein